jgi:hypothetical protein
MPGEVVVAMTTLTSMPAPSYSSATFEDVCSSIGCKWSHGQQACNDPPPLLGAMANQGANSLATATGGKSRSVAEPCHLFDLLGEETFFDAYMHR